MSSQICLDRSQRLFFALMTSCAVCFDVIYYLSLGSLSILNRGLKQRRRRSHRERQKSNGLRLAKQQLGTCITIFCTFLCRHCTTTTWKREHKTTTLFFFPWTSIQSFRIQLQKNSQHLTNWTRWNKRDKVWSSATSHFFSQPSLLLKLPIITSSHNLFYMEMSGEFVRDYWV